MNFNFPIISNSVQFDSNAKFSILIPTWNNLELLQICIDSILKNSEYQHQIIVHANEGTDGTLDWVKSQAIDYTHSQQNVGVCYAMNAMAKLAKCDYILYLNDDMYVCPLWDKYLFETIKNNNDDHFYFSSTMIEPNYSRNLCVINQGFGEDKATFNERALLDFTKTAYKADWFGASWPPSIVHRRLWDLVGGYSVEFSPGFGSDPDFSMKLWQAGVRNFRGIGKSLVYHFQSKSTKRVKRNDARKIFAKKWGFTIRYFYKNVLCLGKPYSQVPLKFSKGLKFYFSKLRNLFK